MQNKKKFYQANWFLWISLIIFPPLGLILLWGVHKDMKKNKKIVLSCIFILWFIIMFSIINDSDVTTDDNSSTQQETEFTKDERTTVISTEADKDLKVELKGKIEKVVGADNLQTFNYIPDNNFSLIVFRGKESFTAKMTVKSMYLDMFKILKEIQPIIDTDVDFNVVYTLKDKYGNENDSIVMKATFTNDTIKKINFDNALSENIPTMADEWWNSPVVDITD